MTSASPRNIFLWNKLYFRNGDSKLPRAVVGAMMTLADKDTFEFWVSRATLGKYTGLSIKQVDRQIAANIKSGWLVRLERGSNLTERANRYKLTVPEMDSSVEADSEGTGQMRPDDRTDVSDKLDICVPLTTDRTTLKSSSNTSNNANTSNRGGAESTAYRWIPKADAPDLPDVSSVDWSPFCSTEERTAFYVRYVLNECQGLGLADTNNELQCEFEGFRLSVVNLSEYVELIEKS